MTAYINKPVIVVQTLVLSLIKYCIRTTSDMVISGVQTQNLAARGAAGEVKKYYHIFPSSRELKLLRLKQKHMFDVSVIVYKILRVIYTDWFSSLSNRQAVTSTFTRQMHNL